MNTQAPADKWPMAMAGMVAPLLLAMGTGCVAPAYEMAREGRSEYPPVQVATEAPPVEVTLHGVIVFRGPGSWKQNALWDEYVISIENVGEEMVTLRSARLADVLGVESIPRNDPWLLEEESRQRVNLAGAETVYALKRGTSKVVTGVSGVAVLLATNPLMIMQPAYVMLAGGIGPAMVDGITERANTSAKEAVEREFARRRLRFPVRIAPGETVSGSLFVRITAGPKRLSIVYTGFTFGSRRVDLDLAALSDLHREPVRVVE